jgi:hypothetical protein
VQHRAFQRNQPRPARGQGDVRIDRVIRIEVDEIGLRAVDLFVFIQMQEVVAARAQRDMSRIGRVDGFAEFGMDSLERLDRGVRQAQGPGLPSEFAHFVEFRQHRVHHGLRAKTESPPTGGLVVSL